MSIRRSSGAARRRGLVVLAVVAAAFGLTATAPSPATAQPPHTAVPRPAAAAIVPHAIPAPPAGFTTTWSDDFSGASGTGIDGNWKYDTGPGSSFGTGEIET